MTKKQTTKYSGRNFVAKNAHKFNKSVTMESKRAKVRSGYIKHKGKDYDTV